MEIIQNEITNLWELYIGDCKFCCFETRERAELGMDLIAELLAASTEKRLYHHGLQEAVAITERELIAEALRRNDNNRSRAARDLKMNRSTLIDKYQRHEKAKSLLGVA
jgi:DNA-binding NtrC family response regulator